MVEFDLTPEMQRKIWRGVNRGRLAGLALRHFVHHKNAYDAATSVGARRYFRSMYRLQWRKGFAIIGFKAT